MSSESTFSAGPSSTSCASSDDIRVKSSNSNLAKCDCHSLYSAITGSLHMHTSLCLINYLHLVRRLDH